MKSLTVVMAMVGVVGVAVAAQTGAAKPGGTKPVAAQPATAKPETPQPETPKPESAKPGVNPRAEAVSEFGKRLQAYLDVRSKADNGLPKLKETDEPAKITAHEVALGDAVRKLRATAKPGDVFGTDMTPLILEIVRADWKKRAPADRAAVLAEMPKPFVPKVNMRYPVGQPLMTFPPNLLKQLHQLPDDLEYRFVGRDLILRDVKANIVVDVIRHALPSVS